MKPVKIGIVGAGGRAAKLIKFYNALDGVEVTGICGIIPEQTRQLAEDLQVPGWYNSFSEMLSSCGMDAVDIVTPNHTHAEYARMALEHKKHVLCEKPAALSTEELLQVADLAKRENCVLMYGLQGRFVEKVQYTRHLIENGELGRVYFTKAKYVRRCGNPGSWFATKSQSGGGPLIDLGVHAIDLILYLLGGAKPVSVFASTYNMFGKREHIREHSWYKAAGYGTGAFDTEDLAIAMIKFDDGSTFQLEVSYDSHIKPTQEVFTLDIYGNRAGVALEPAFEIYTEKDGYLVDIIPQMGDITMNWNQGLARQLEHFVGCVRGDEKSTVPLADVISGMKVIDAIYESAKTGRSVEVQ